MPFNSPNAMVRILSSSNVVNGWIQKFFLEGHSVKYFLMLLKPHTMKNSFLDYYKVILDKVSFDNDLLVKEYRKAMRLLREDEIGELHRWLDQKGLSLYTFSSDQVSGL